MATKHLSRRKFLARLEASGLCTSKELAQAQEIAAESADVRELAKTLVKRGMLTRFQAEMIFRGRVDGFILGQYRILDHIGRGGMGRVFRAEHTTMRRTVAIKVLAPHLMQTERARELFQREVRAAARLVHPHIVTAFDANQAGDRHYLVMEYVDGPNLHELVHERGPLPVGQACEFVRQAALGLQHAYELGMVHRDIKPANLLISRGSGQGCIVKILDFGLARLHEPLPNAVAGGQDSLPAFDRQVMGTPDFLSPEQARSLHKADIRSDLYSLGCTLFYLLTGQVPFPGGSSLEKLVRHGTETPQPLHHLRTDIPEEVSAIVAKLLAKRPADRYQTPLELVHALAPFACEISSEFAPLEPTPVTGSGESPWANLFDSDEGKAFQSTLPANLCVTPVHPTLRQKLAAMKVPETVVEPPRRGWVKIGIIIGAALLGFLLGALSLLLLMI